MPPWAPRLTSHHPSSHTLNTDVNSASSRPDDPAPSWALISPTSASPAQLVPHLAPPRTHSRSTSNPFPAILKGYKKVHKKKSETGFVQDPSSTDDEVTVPAPAPAGRKSESSSHAMSLSRDPLQGHCMTCGAAVRWPRGVKTFRCTICVTVNDLEPCGSKPASKSHQRSTSQEQRTFPPVSFETTRRMVDRCTSAYLQNRLRRLERPPDPPTRIPPPPVYRSSQDEDEEHRPYNEVRDRTFDIPIRPAELTVPMSNSLPNSDRPRSNQEFSSNNPYAQPRGDALPPPPPEYSAYGQPNQPGQQRSDGRMGGSNRTGAEHMRAQPPEGDLGSSRPIIFRPLEDYIISVFSNCETLNDSFLPARPGQPFRAASEGDQPQPQQEDVENEDVGAPPQNGFLSEVDAKALLMGDIGENGSWWTGNRRGGQKASNVREKSPDPGSHKVSQKTPRIEWEMLNRWYRMIIHAGDNWLEKWQHMRPERRNQGQESFDAETYMWESIPLATLERDIADSQQHLQRTLLKATENLLKRPKRFLRRPEDSRFLFILLANPLLYSSGSSSSMGQSRTQSSNQANEPYLRPGNAERPERPGNRSRQNSSSAGAPNGASHHSGIIKRILGMLSNMSDDCHKYFVAWFSRFSETHFQRLVDLVGRFLTYRLSRHQQSPNPRKKSNPNAPNSDLIPTLSGSGGSASTQLHAAISGHSAQKRPGGDPQPHPTGYPNDWQVKAAARVMSLLFSANGSHHGVKRDVSSMHQGRHSAGLTARNRAHAHGQMLPISAFYNTLLDYFNLVADFESWESRTSKFSFCQYPFFLSIWAKIHIMEHDARRQMEVRAREAFFNSILTRNVESQYLVLKVRRDCLVEDSMGGVSEVVGSTPSNIKKGLKIEFLGEEGVDAGGLRKEWFLLLVREVFDPQHGLFIYDEESHFCYFNPYCFESSEQFFLVGVLLGLAIYNSTILDVALPPFAFKKLLASAPANTSLTTSAPRLSSKYTLEDLAEFRPSLAKGLRGLLEFDGDVEETFCRDFVADVERYGEVIQVPLCPGGAQRPVTNQNRREFVDLYITYLLDTAVARQFEPFKRGFFIVCGGNALSLFRPEEIELLVRGSDEPLDISSLQAVAVYENWPTPNPSAEPVVHWFWDFFARISPDDQRKILSFITGSDRIPAMGATNLIIKIMCLGEDSDRFPTARTCFNSVALFRYQSRQKLEGMLWRAVCESEGFGLK